MFANTQFHTGSCRLKIPVSSHIFNFSSCCCYHKLKLLKMGLLAALIVNAVGGAAIYATGGLLTPIVAPALGFGSAGVGAGSIAAGAMSYYGNVAAGSVISQMTAAAMVAPTP